MSSTEINYATLPRESLEGLIIQFNDKVIEQKIANDPNDNALKYLCGEIEKISAEIQRRNEIPAEMPVQNDQKLNSKYLHIQKELQNAMRDYVPTFQSGVDVHTFINALELYHKIYIVPNPSAEFEKMFVRMSTSKMSVEYGSTMMNHKPTVETFEALKDYLKSHHASKMSCYQTLDVMWDLQILDSENLRDFARKLDEKAVESRNIIESKFESSMKSKSAELKNKIEPAGPEEFKMASKDVFQMLSGQIFLQMLKSKRPNVYNQIVNDLDQVWTAIDIANLAMSYEDRMAKDYSQNQATLTTSCTAVKPKQDFNKSCWSYLNGKCTFGEKCNRNHDSGLKKSFDIAGLRINKYGKIVKKDKKDQKDQNDKKPSGGGGNGESLVATLNNQVFHQ